QDDPDPSNNTEYAIIIIDGGPGVNPDVRIVKTASDYNVNLNDLVTFTIQVFNDGPGTATDIQVTDLLHPGFEYQSSSPAGQYNSQTGVWTVGSITAGSSSTLTITVRALQEGVLANEAVLTRVRPGDSDPNNNNSTIFVNVGQRQGIDLQIVKEVTSLPDPAHIGDNVEFTVTVTNLSTTLTATDVRVIDMLPPGLDYVSHFPPAYDYTPATGEWNIGSIGPLQSMMIAITARIVMSGEIENCAYIDNSANPDPNTTNDEDCTSFTVIDEGADLEVNKVASITTPSVGDPVSFLVTVTNNGPEDATNIILHDILPAGVSYQSSTPSQGSFTQATGYWIWNVGSLANGATASLTIMTQAIQEGTWTNHALIISADQVDPDQTSNHAMAIIEIYDGPPDFPDLSVGKTVNNSNPSLGSQVIFTITVSNIGSGTASSVEITDILHPGLTFVSKWTSQGTYDETAGIWNVGTIAMGNVAQLRITATVDQEGTLSNYAVLTRALPGDDDPNNNQAWVFLYVDPSGPVADLSITKDAQISGTDIIYIIVVTNNGPSATDDVIIHDRLLPGILYVTHSASAGSYNPGTGLWHVGTLANGQSATLNITIHPEGFEDVENCAMVYNSSARDTNLSNDFACVTTSMGATVFLRIYLEGPFRFERTNNTHPDPSLMGTKLRHPAWNNGNSMIPIISPYPDARNAGVVNSNDLPADIVDWVYLQFRPAGDYEETEIVLGNDATGISCFLRDDGRIVDIDGSDGVRVAGLPEGQYYLIVDHRNHLKVMSATPVDTRELTDYNFGSTPKHYYDFTEAITQYLTPTGENLDRGCSQTPVDGKWMMSAGDGEKSHSVDQWDYNRWFELSDLNVGYWQLDHDLGGQIEGRDESFYYMNMGLRSPFSWLP
ncbi:DUF11 domain-containing protein, partial [candidate division KSB1 bacterium]|nr:DUF11 domain-containing protein [candidate division KSB1 bacterium]